MEANRSPDSAVFKMCLELINIRYASGLEHLSYVEISHMQKMCEF
jgi:hypothetical protein